MTGPVSRWHTARSASAMGLASEVRMSASRKSAQVTSRNGVLMRASVLEKKSLVSCRSQCDEGIVFMTVPVRAFGIGLEWIHGLCGNCVISGIELSGMFVSISV